MSQGLRPLHAQELLAELEGLLLPWLQQVLQTRAAGHCMRLGDLDLELMVRLAGRLQAESPEASVFVLSDGDAEGIPPQLAISSTRLVELRNPFPDGAQRPPLLVFVPNETRAAAEDSFGVATFEALRPADLYPRLRADLLEGCPGSIRGALTEGLSGLGGGDPWPFADLSAQVRFLLTAKVNGGDAEAYGGALFELGLIPDFTLFADPAQAPRRMARNRECVEKITWSSHSERGRVLELGLAKRAFRIQLAEYLARTGVEDPRAWTRGIVLQRENWPLAFHRWEFEDDADTPDGIHIHSVEAALPKADDSSEDERLEQLLGQLYLPVGPQGLAKFSVAFQVEPLPSRVQGLAKFLVQVVSREQGPVGLVRSKAAWKSNSRKATLTLNKLTKVDWEEGWHFVRVLPVTEEGDLIPLLDAEGEPMPWGGDDDGATTFSHQSEPFYVLPEGELENPPPQRAKPKYPSLAHARIRLQFTHLLEGGEAKRFEPSEVTWVQGKGRGGTARNLEAEFSRLGKVQISVSAALERLERQILERPDGPVSWRLPIRMGAIESPSGEHMEWPDDEVTQRFLAARGAYFSKLSGSDALVSQGADFARLREEALAYAAAYLDLLGSLRQQVARADATDGREAHVLLRQLLAIDSILLVITDYKGGRKEAALASPTHPLRALWLATWDRLADQWLENATGAARDAIVPTRDALLQQLQPLAHPSALMQESGRLLTAVENLHPFWTLYAQPGEGDLRGMVGDICAALGLPEPALGGTLIDGAYLGQRVRRYLLQHPYVQTLVINAFNPGRGALLAELLLDLQQEASFADLRYDIRLFVPDADAPGVGSALLDLLSPNASTTAKEAEAFATPAESHLHPKLRVAIRPHGEFNGDRQRHAAHLSLLFDLFPAEEIAATAADRRESAAPVHGLIQEFHVAYREDEETVAWSRQPRHGRARDIEDAAEYADLLATLSADISAASAMVATGQAGMDLRPAIRMHLDRMERALLHQVHEVSDWVFTLDRNLGIEFFDHGGRPGRPDYLIDHSPDLQVSIGHRLIVSSRSVTELEAMLAPVLADYQLPNEARHVVSILGQLRSLSGRMALKLISAPTQRAEALGLALSRLYLEHQGVFENQVVAPLDAHLELYHSLQTQRNEWGDEVSFKRTDLALFDLDPHRRLLTCRLVEVKCYNQVGDLGAFNQLKGAIAEQIEQSQAVLARHFDPHRDPVDRPDRLIKTNQLCALLEFYLDRAERYGLILPEAAEEARFFLRTLEDGYRLQFTRSALIVDFEKAGAGPAEIEQGIEFHRIGVDLIRELVEAAGDAAEVSRTLTAEQLESVPMAAPAQSELEIRRERTPSIPTLDSAAFLAAARDRSVSWEDLHSRQELGIEEDQTEESATGDTASPAPQGGRKEVSGSAAPEVDGGSGSVIPEDESSGNQLPEAVDGTSGRPIPEAGYSGSRVPEPHEEVAGKEDGRPGQEGQTATSASHQVAQDMSDGPAFDVLLGVTDTSPQYGLLGEASGRKVALDLNQTHTISLFGVQGGGKSYTLGSVAEMASLAIPGINRLTHPLATVIFHYSPTMDYSPEFTSMVAGNDDAKQLRLLKEVYGAEPKALEDVLLLTPADKVAERQAEYPGIQVLPLKFSSRELQAPHWRFLMGAVGNQATYLRQLNRVMKSLRDRLTLEALREGVETSRMSDSLKELAQMRLDLAAEYIDDNVNLGDEIRPGRLVIVDLRDEFIEKDEALGLFVVLLQLFADAKYQGGEFNKLVVFDEAHKYIESPDLVAGLVAVVREMRHKGTSIMVASQDPPSVPVSLIELSSQIILHKFNSPAWLKHIQKANAALAALTPEKMAHLRPGEAFVWSSKATDDAFTKGAQKIRCRPRVTRHGGGTKTAVEEN